MTRVQVLLEEQERGQFRREAEREGLSLSAWLRRAGQDRLGTLDAAFELVESLVSTVWVVEPEDVRFARDLVARNPELEVRDLLHLAGCRRRGVADLMTFDRPLAAAFRRR